MQYDITVHPVRARTILSLGGFAVFGLSVIAYSILWNASLSDICALLLVSMMAAVWDVVALTMCLGIIYIYIVMAAVWDVVALTMCLGIIYIYIVYVDKTITA